TRSNQARLKRSRFITLVHAATKSFTNFSFDRVVFGILSEARDKVLPLLDKGAELMRHARWHPSESATTPVRASTSPWSIRKTRAQGYAHRVGPVAGAHLAKGIAQMQARGDFGDAQRMGDHLVAHSAGEQPNDLDLALGELETLPAVVALGLGGQRLDPQRRRHNTLAGKNAFEGLDHRLAGEVLRDHAGRAAPQGLRHLLACHVAGENDDGDVGMTLAGDLDALDPLHARHDEVEQQRVRPRRGDAIERFAEAARLDELRRERTLPQVVAKRLAEEVVIVGDHQPHGVPSVRGTIGIAPSRPQRRQIDREPAAEARPAVDLDGTAMSDDDAVDDGKPKTRTLTPRLGGEKRLEGMLLDGLAHADAVVDAFNPEIPAGAHIEPLRRLAVNGVKPGRERDHALARADGIGGVGNEIEQD